MTYASLITALCRADGVPEPVFEFAFAKPRRWRFDACWPYDDRPGGVALEIQGGLFVRGRHSRGAALLKEHSKLNAAAAMGFRVMFCTPQTIAEVWPSVRTAVKG